MTGDEMIQKFQCPGCVGGPFRKCYKAASEAPAFRCKAHVCGTMMLGVGSMALGLPKGFCKCNAADDTTSRTRQTTNFLHIRCWMEGTAPKWDYLNVPVWAMENDGFLFVRSFSPRIGWHCVDVIEGGTMAMAPNAFDIGTRIDDID